MRVSVDIDDEEVKARIRSLRVKAPAEVRKGFGRIAGAFIRFFTRRRLSGRVGNVGLFRRTGSLARNLIFRTTGTQVRNIETRVGWLDARTAQIARVHELGTVSKGGSLPDIVPRTAKLLRWQVRDANRSIGQTQGYAFARKVGIPPRLEFRASWSAPGFRKVLDAELKRAAEGWRDA